MVAEDRAATREYYDRFGDAEWVRLADDVAGRVSFEVHRRFLSRFVREGDQLLEVGAGPGRFTAELAALGARVVVTDLSPVQLDLNREHVGDSEAEFAVERRELLDVFDVTRYDDGAFARCARLRRGPVVCLRRHPGRPARSAADHRPRR